MMPLPRLRSWFASGIEPISSAAALRFDETKWRVEARETDDYTSTISYLSAFIFTSFHSLCPFLFSAECYPPDEALRAGFHIACARGAIWRNILPSLPIWSRGSRAHVARQRPPSMMPLEQHRLSVARHLAVT